MDFETLKTWLTGQAEKQAKTCWLKGLLGCALCPLALFIATAFVYGVMQAFTHRYIYQWGDSDKFWLISLAIIPLLFIGNRLMSPTDDLEDRLGDPESRAWSRFGPNRSVVQLLILCWLAFTGPKLLDWAMKSFREARLWRNQDNHSCAAVLWLLASRSKRVPFEDLEREIPWLNLPAVLPELARIPGLLNLKGPPPGLALNDDLRHAIRTGGELGPSQADLQLG